MKKLFILSFAALMTALFSMTMVSCGPAEPENSGGNGGGNDKPTTVAVTGISLNKTSLSLKEGGTETLSATVAPANATNKNVSWKSSDASVASVDASGKVTAVKAGTATITVTTEDGGKTATCAVTVTAATVAVTGVSLNKTTLSLDIGASETLSATVAPANATNKNVSWKSSDASVASVDASGKVTAVKAGTATITVTTEDGGKTATCAVTVKAAPVVSVTGVSLNKTYLVIPAGESETLTATVAPANATNKNVSWKSSNSSIASVDENGMVTGKRTGTTAIIVTTEDGGKTATCTLMVTSGSSETVSVTGVSLDKTSLSLVKGASQTLTATVAPSNATNKNVSWKSSNSSIATVDANGKVTAVKAGSATITVTTEDGGKTATCAVTVTEATVSVTGVSLNKSSLSLTVGSSETLTATVQPSNATNKSVSWKSSNTGVATVDSNGKVTAKAAGSATITVTTADGGKTATCSVTVKAATVAVTGVSFGSTTPVGIYTAGPSQTCVLSYTIYPSNATNKNVTWKSSNTSVATVDSNGKVTGKSAGNTTITVTTEDGGFTASITVYVSTFYFVNSITLTSSTLTMNVNQTVGLTYTVSPSNATIPYLDWTSSDNSVVEVVENVVSDPSNPPYVKAKKIGTATITATARDGSGKTASCKITVK